jgi:tungstate transport system substrate-binding protein
MRGQSILLAVICGMLGVMTAMPASGQAGAQPEATPAPVPGGRVKVATTTSLYDTGLWYALSPAFTAETGLKLDIIYAGTGRALAWGARGDVDVVVTHSPTQEAAFLAEGHGRERVAFAYNHFLIAGPADDPANLAALAPAAAFAALHAAARYPFVSRGDDSGTHAREKTIWRAAGLDPAAVRDAGRWYVEAGLGMGPTLAMAAQLQAYTLTDIGTFLAYRAELDLAPIVTEGQALLNVYAVIVCTRAANPAGAEQLAAFLTGERGQALIGDFGRETHGVSLFMPCAGRACGDDDPGSP